MNRKKYRFMGSTRILQIFVSSFLLLSCTKVLRSPNRLTATDQSLYSCFENHQFKLCIPSPTKGLNILGVVAADVQAKKDMDSELSKFMPTSYRSTHFEMMQSLVNPQAPAELRIKADYPGFLVYDIKHYFPDFIRESFNTMTKFSGPNCYNTALIMAGLLKKEQRFAISVEEFEVYLDTYYKVTNDKPQFGDIIVYDATQKRDHVAFYLFNDLVFHKKGFDRNYRYRIARIDQVYNSEPFEESLDQVSAGTHLDSLAIQKNMKVYRVVPDRDQPLTPMGQEKVVIEMVDFLTQMVVDNAPSKRVHEAMGVSSELLFEDLLREFKPMKNSHIFSVRAAYTRLISLQHQVFLSIEDELYKSPFAHRDRIHQEYCVAQTEYPRILMEHLFSYKQGRRPDTKETALMLAKLKNIDKLKCNFHYMELVENIPM